MFQFFDIIIFFKKKIPPSGLSEKSWAMLARHGICIGLEIPCSKHDFLCRALYRVQFCLVCTYCVVPEKYACQESGMARGEDTRDPTPTGKIISCCEDFTPSGSCGAALRGTEWAQIRKMIRSAQIGSPKQSRFGSVFCYPVRLGCNPLELYKYRPGSCPVSVPCGPDAVASSSKLRSLTVLGCDLRWKVRCELSSFM